MSQARYELRLADGSTAEWVGADGEDAARRYVDVHRDAAVVASRRAERHGLFVLGSPAQIIG